MVTHLLFLLLLVVILGRKVKIDIELRLGERTGSRGPVHPLVSLLPCQVAVLDAMRVRCVRTQAAPIVGCTNSQIVDQRFVHFCGA